VVTKTPITTAARATVTGKCKRASAVEVLAFRETILWMAFPLAYVTYALIRGAIVNWYPYFFVNPHRHGGYLLVAGDCAAITVGIVGLVAATT
jgi:hypothetical protein